MNLDPRMTLARDDLASTALEGLVRAARYAPPTPRRAIRPAVAIRAAADSRAEQVDQLLYGEAFDVLEAAGGVAWGQARRDGYVGYVDADALGADDAPTHQVAVLRTYAFDAPEGRSRVAAGPLTLNALVRVEAEAEAFVRAAGLGWIAASHLAPIGVVQADHTAVAEQFLGAAYVWGGRESTGLDCSGLVQQALFACGRACPRDTDLQLAAFTQEVTAKALRRGDLVFWPGHVAIALDHTTVLHANGHRMLVTREALAEVTARRLAAGEGAPIAYRRPWT